MIFPTSRHHTLMVNLLAVAHCVVMTACASPPSPVWPAALEPGPEQSRLLTVAARVPYAAGYIFYTTR